MDKLSKMKEDYEAIRVPQETYTKVYKTILKERRKRKFLRSLSASAACACLAFTLIVNVNKNVAIALADSSVMGEIVRVVTFGRYENSQDGYEIIVETPQIKGLIDKDTEQFLNETFKENSNKIIAEIEVDMEDLKEEFGEEDVHIGVISNFTIKTDNDNILALDVYLLKTAGSSATVHTFYNIDKRSGKLFKFSELFKAESNYKEIINDYIKEQIKERKKKEDGLYFVDDIAGFTSIDDEQNFYIDDNNQVVICFDKYEIAVGAEGSPEFALPKELTKTILR